MRSIVFGLALVLALVPAAHAQNLAIPAPAPASQPDLRRVEAPTPAVRAELATTPIQAIAVGNEVADAKAAAQISARNVLAIIGAAVVVVALVAFFN